MLEPRAESLDSLALGQGIAQSNAARGIAMHANMVQRRARDYVYALLDHCGICRQYRNGFNNISLCHECEHSQFLSGGV